MRIYQWDRRSSFPCDPLMYRLGDIIYSPKDCSFDMMKKEDVFALAKESYERILKLEQEIRELKYDKS